MEETTVRSTETRSPEHVTIVRERGSSGGMIVAIIALVLIAVAAFWAFGSGGNESSDNGVAAAADKVGAAADKVGEAAETAGRRMTE